MDIISANTDEGSDLYAAYIGGYPDALVYHTPAYLSAISRITGGRVSSIVAVERGQPVGAIPMITLDGPYGRVINSLPFFGSNGGVLAPTDRVRRHLVGHLLAMVEDPEVLSATLIESPLRRDDELGRESDFIDSRISMLSALSRAEDQHEIEAETLQRMQSSARRNIRHAEASGVRVRKALDRDAPAIQALHVESMQAVGAPPKPPTFFEVLIDPPWTGDQQLLLVAEHEGEVVGALLVLMSATVAEYYMPVVDRNRSALQATPLLVLHAMVEASKKGRHWFNWGGTHQNMQGVYRFKKKFGVAESTYRYFTFTRRGHDLQSLGADEIREAYPFFFVAPFSALAGQ